jgi:Na+/melibiose symporter-like transporter
MAAPLRPWLKLAYAGGTITFAAKDVAVINFVLFYYRQVLGLSGKLAGLALLIAMISDALSDPVMGSISDRTRGRWGRRHPYMALGTLPLALCFLVLFRPPSGLGEPALFVWLTLAAIALRNCLTVFYVPYLALGAELADDYHERSSVTTYRTTVGWIVALLFYWASLRWIFAPGSDGIDGRLVASNYWTFGVCACLLVIVFGFGSTWLTRREIPRLPTAARGSPGSGLAGTFSDLLAVLHCRNFRIMFLVMMASYMLLGVFPAVAMHMGTYFWEFTASQMGTIGLLMITANLFVFAVGDALSRRIEKHRLLQLAFLIYGVNLVWMVGARLLGLLPENGARALLVVYFCYSFVQTAAMMIIHIVPASLLADIVDEHELETGRRQEGVFFAAQGFAAKAVSGFGTLFGGWALDLSGMPERAAPGQVPAEVLSRLGLMVGPLLGLLFLVPLLLSTRFTLTRARLEEIQVALAERRRRAPPEHVVRAGDRETLGGAAAAAGTEG